MSSTTLSTLLNTDFCPWANQYVYWLKKPLGILIVAAFASLLCGLFVYEAFGLWRDARRRLSLADEGAEGVKDDQTIAEEMQRIAEAEE